ncbi:MAG: T9SS type A sorting domain-containing protein [Chitinophagaceae bacterium]|nr:T9SS type A sorting domain-containing protein [Chitinophagaceae bacterium]
MINSILLSTIAIEDFTLGSTEIDDLLEIASQCPFTGGPAVYEARELLFLSGDATTFDDAELCDTSSSPKYSNETDLHFSLYPNPAATFINIMCPETFQVNTFIIIEDLSGRRLKREQLTAELNVKQISIENLSAGLYLVKIERNDVDLFNQKLVLLR